MGRQAFLKEIALFRALPDDAIQALAEATEPVSVRAGQTVIADGTVGDTLYLVVEGQVAVRKGGRTLALLGAGDYFGEMALIDDAPRAAAVVAESDVKLLCLSRLVFQSLIQDHPSVLAELCHLFVRRLRLAQQMATAVRADAGAWMAAQGADAPPVDG
jgi:CRP-like cAMP-binding protein